MINSIDTKEWKNDESCTCNTSKFCDPFHKHIVTGDLNVIENRDLRHLLMKGPNYREPCLINWNKVVSCIIALQNARKDGQAKRTLIEQFLMNGLVLF